MKNIFVVLGARIKFTLSHSKSNGIETTISASIGVGFNSNVAGVGQEINVKFI